MIKLSIFPLSFFLALGLCNVQAQSTVPSLSRPAAIQASTQNGSQKPEDPDWDLKSQKPAHDHEINQIELDRRAFQRDFAVREEACLRRFFSARCMEQLRTEYMSAMRDFDLSREAQLQALRDIDAAIRDRLRNRRSQQLATLPAGPIETHVPSKPRPLVSSAAEAGSSDLQRGPESQAVMLTQAWAKAWSEKDFNVYVGFYSARFSSQGHSSREAWKSARQARLSKPGVISVQLSDLRAEIQPSGDIRVTFVQRYSSKEYADTTQKSLIWTPESGSWKIRSESDR